MTGKRKSKFSIGVKVSAEQFDIYLRPAYFAAVITLSLFHCFWLYGIYILFIDPNSEGGETDDVFNSDEKQKELSHNSATTRRSKYG